MIEIMEANGYDYTGEYLYLPPGYKRRQPIWRFQARNSLAKVLSLEEVKKLFEGMRVTIHASCCQYAPEIKSFLITNER